MPNWVENDSNKGVKKRRKRWEVDGRLAKFPVFFSFNYLVF